MDSKPPLYLTDTTLRDGEQSPGLVFDHTAKTEIAVLLDGLGFCVIEAGIPAMGSFEKETICRIMDLRKKAKIAVWNRMSPGDIAHSFDCRPDVIHISAPVSDNLIFSVLRQNHAWVENMLKACVFLAKDKGYEVTVGFQDASRADLSFMTGLAADLSGLGVSAIRLADTVGILTPSAIRRIVLHFKENISLPIGIHTHNDLGMAESTALEAAKSGASFIDTTLFGVGERAGNCDSFVFAEAADPLYNVLPSYRALGNQKSHIRRLIYKE
ncbi:MAG TPA: hypothetical protein VN381_05380 [Anaerovoracaceae bacterium]|nr:hypothetical protein [Anaerovoracaceae bacterium]